MATPARRKTSRRRLRAESLEQRYLCASDWQNTTNPVDIDGSGLIEPVDALYVVNELIRTGSRTLPTKSLDYTGPLFDSSGDNRITPTDALLVINSIINVEAGDIAPRVSLPNQKGETVDLSTFLGNSAVVLYFYPKDDTPGCTIEALDFSARKTEIESLGAKIFGVSLDSVDSHEDFADKHELSFDILADASQSVTKKYHVMTETAAGSPIARRTTFIIGKDGVIKQVFTDVQVAAHGAEVVAALRAGVGN